MYTYILPSENIWTHEITFTFITTLDSQACFNFGQTSLFQLWVGADLLWKGDLRVDTYILTNDLFIEMTFPLSKIQLINVELFLDTD